MEFQLTLKVKGSTIEVHLRYTGLYNLTNINILIWSSVRPRHVVEDDDEFLDRGDAIGGEETSPFNAIGDSILFDLDKVEVIFSHVPPKLHYY